MIQVLFLIAIWIIPIFLSRNANAYLKMNNEEKTELKNLSFSLVSGLLS
jgi:hydrogenase-4 membrane subunit HyfE